MKRLVFGLLGSAILVSACGGSGPEPTVYRGDEMLETGMTIKQSIETRQHNLKDLGGAYKTVTDQLSSGDPNFQEIKFAVDEIARHGSDMPYWFPAGTGPDSGVETEALAKIWDEPDAFKSELASFKAASDALKAASDAEDLDALQSASRNVGAGCKSCHDQYRLDD